MENGETTIEGALRETQEEAAFKPVSPKLISVISLPQWDQIHIFYQVDMIDFSFSTTPESNAVDLFKEEDIPWDNLAFQTVSQTLKHYFNIGTNGFSVLNSEVRL